MKVIIAGGRDFVAHPGDEDILWALHGIYTFTEVVCGMASGADLYGLDFAKRNNIPVKKFPADWAKFGKAAGPIRNSHMAHYADMLVAFPGGKGTADMVQQAIDRGLMVFDLRYSRPREKYEAQSS